ncbi:MAG TPA: DUF3617 family protein [Usitatibacteraceae bacterium]
MKATVLLFALAATALPPLVAQADNKEMPAGLWEMKMKMEMPGMPPEMAAMMGGGRTTTHCVKPGERKWTDREKSPRDQKCEQTDMKVDGNKVSWKMKCVDGTTGEGTITHNGKDAYTMDNTMKTAQGTMKMHIDGKKIADTCDKK